MVPWKRFRFLHAFAKIDGLDELKRDQRKTWCVQIAYLAIMVTTRVGHAKKKVAELAAHSREYCQPSSYDHDVDNHSLSFEELK